MSQRWIPVCLSILLTCSAVQVSEAASIDLSSYDSGGNFVGLAVDSATGHIFLTGLGFGGGPKLWEFDRNGTLLSSSIPIGLATIDEITSLVVSNTGTLFASVAYPAPDWADIRRYVVEMNQAGTEISSSFRTEEFVGGYDPDTGNLFLPLCLNNADCSGCAATVYEVSPDGVLVNSFDVTMPGSGTLGGPGGPFDIAYNPLTGSIFGAYYTVDGWLLAEYKRVGHKKWKLKDYYDFSSTGLSEIYGLDVDISTGLF
jgi:hypothetical protein